MQKLENDLFKSPIFLEPYRNLDRKNNFRDYSYDPY